LRQSMAGPKGLRPLWADLERKFKWGRRAETAPELNQKKGPLWAGRIFDGEGWRD
jgi:hypothetical protein